MLPVYFSFDLILRNKMIELKIPKIARQIICEVCNKVAKNNLFKIGKYEIKFYCGEYFKNFTKLSEVPFLDDVVIRFGISDINEHYHVPLLISPWSYTTYRGS